MPHWQIWVLADFQQRLKTLNIFPLNSNVLQIVLVIVTMTIDAKFGLGLELAKLATNESDSDYDIVIQKVTSAENAKCVQ